MSRKMYGVVLWADQTEQKAVIWCEDHGDLAYWHDSNPSIHDGAELDVGDLIQFEVTEGESLRRASNPERLESQSYFGLAQSLRAAESPATPSMVDRPAGERVIAFPGARRREKAFVA